MKSNRLALRLAASALAISLIALGLAAYSLSVSQQYLEDVRVLGLALQRGEANTGGTLQGPPPTLETD